MANPLTAAELAAIIDEAINHAELVRSDRVGSQAEHAEIDAHIAALKNLLATVEADRAVLADVALWADTTEQAVPGVYTRTELRRLGTRARALLGKE